MKSLILGSAALRLGTVMLGALCLAVASAVLILLAEPRAPLLLISAACLVISSVVLLPQPILAIVLALLLRLVPHGLYGPELDTLFTVVVNGLLALALGAWALQCWTHRLPVIWNPTCILLGCYIAWCAFTVFWAADPIAARRSLVAYTAGWILLFLISNQIRTVQSLDSVMRALRIMGWIMVIGGIHALLFTNFEFGERLKVNNVNENQYGVIMIAMLPGVIWPALSRYGKGRAIHLGLSVIFVIGMLLMVALSGSRGSSLSLFLVLFLFWFWKPVRPWGVVGLVLLCIMAVSAPFVLDTLVARFESDDGDLGGRGAIWQASLAMLLEFPWTGVGIGNSPAALNVYIANVTSDFQHRLDLPSHNPFLEVGLDTGLLGVLLYAATCTSAAVQLFAARTRLAMLRPELAGYYPLILVTAIGYFMVWIKGGGLHADTTFFTILALLIIPSQLGPEHAAGHRVPVSRRYVSSDGEEHPQPHAAMRQPQWQGSRSAVQPYGSAVETGRSAVRRRHPR